MLAQEGIRRLRNTRPDLVENLKVELMEDFAEMMMKSGYPEHLRASVIQAVLVGYGRQVEAASRRETSLSTTAMEGGGEKEGKELEEGCVVPTSRCCALPASHPRLLVG